MRAGLLAGVALTGFAVHQASAANITAFSQTSSSNTIQAETDSANTETFIAVTNAALSIGQFLGGIPASAEFFLSAHSIDAAQPIGSAVIQHYTGNFCITSLGGCLGVNYLSGVFTDAAFGALGGPGLAVNVNSPPDALALSSAVVPLDELQAPKAFTLAFTNLSPDLAIVGTTIAPFSASFAGTVSASEGVPVPEPMALVVFGTGLLGLAMVRRRRG
jgi:hypothetical protein